MTEKPNAENRSRQVFLSVAAIPVQLTKSPFPTITVMFYGFQALVVLALVWSRAKSFR